jgi:hypothetical protein
MQPNTPILLQLYNAVLEDIRFHRNQLFRLEQRAYNLEHEILSVLHRRRLIPTDSRDTPPNQLPPPAASTTSATAPSLSPEPPPILRNSQRRSYSSFSFEGLEGNPPTEQDPPRNISPLLHPLSSSSRESESPPPATELPNAGFTFLGSFDLPLGIESLESSGRTTGGAEGRFSRVGEQPILPTSFARSLLTRGLTSSSASSSLVPPSIPNMSDSSAFLLYFMLENMSNETEQHGITDISRFVTDRLFEEIESPPNTCCPIRMDVFTAQSEVSEINKCKHIFCRQEIRTWLQTHHTCPLCRTPIDVD